MSSGNADLTAKEHQFVVIDYMNYRGERRERIVWPLTFVFGKSPFHDDGEQWFMNAMDMETGNYRMFAMKDIHSWKPK
jgi:predicted DNA-binding transcriptional regulator YafY